MPSNGAVLGDFSPTLDWYDSVKISGNPDSNAVGYELQIAKGLSNLKDADLISVEKSVYAIPFNFLTTAGTYYWHVRAFNGESNSIWSATYSFTTPAMVSGLVSDVINDPDGLTGLAGVTIQIEGRAIQVTTAPDGTYQLRGLIPGSYTLIASAPGYARQRISFSVGTGSNLTRNFRLVPFPELDTQYRIILYWNGTPKNLDAHLFLPPVDGNAYNLYDADDHRGDLFVNGAELNVGELTTGFGPEVITIDTFIGGKYTYAVYLDDSDLSKLASSQARVYVYQGST